VAIDNYSDLVAAFNEEIARVETSRVPNLLAQVEADLNSNKDFRLSDMQITVTLTTVANNSSVALPSDFLQLDALFIDSEPARISYLPENQANSLQSQTVSGRPVYYTILGNKTLKLYPAPDRAYGIILRYKAKVPALTSLAPINWLLTKNPNIYLHGAAFFFAPKLKDYRQLEMYRSFYDRAVRMAIDSDTTSYSLPSNDLPTYALDR
jgi:hypothetical protein